MTKVSTMLNANLGEERRLRRAALIVALVAVVGVASIDLAAVDALSAQPPSVATAARRPAATPQPPFSSQWFGISAGSDLTQESPALFDNEFNLMRHIGVHWVRAIIPWAQVEHDAPGQGNWILVDRLVNMTQAEGMQLDAIIDNVPAWAYRSPSTTNCPTQPPFDINAYATFAAAVATRYGSSRVRAIEIENAPNLTGAWPSPNACGYTRMMQAAYTTIKSADPAITVLTAGLGAQNNSKGGVAGDTFLQQMYQYGAHGAFDAVSWHPYSYPCFPSATCKTQRPWYRTAVVRQLMVANGDGDKQIWATEFGAPTNGQPGDGHVDENTQAAMMVDAMKHWVTLPYGGPFFVFEMRDTGGATTKKSNWFGVQSHNSHHKKLSYWAYQYEATGHTNFPLPQNVIDGVPES